jgi:hypothetical protein
MPEYFAKHCSTRYKGTTFAQLETIDMGSAICWISK